LSRIARLEIGDLQPDRLRLMLPRSAKGHDRSKKHERRAVPIPASLVTLLLEAAAGRSSDSPLLLRTNGRKSTPQGFPRRGRRARARS
jgi:hypothetical protein